MTMTERIGTYRDFWPYYLREHAKRGTRALHFLGTGSSIALLAALAATGDWRWLLGAVVVGYAFAWIGHFLIERNRPATFAYPLWSLASDFRMLFLFLAGRLGDELRRHQIR